MLLLSLLFLPAATAQDDGSSYGEVPTGEATGEAAATNPHTAWTQANSIRLTFDPARSAYAKSCSDIRHVQVLRMNADGVAILPSKLRKKDAWMDATASDGGWVIDSVNGPSKPYYQEDTDSGIGRTEPQRVAVLVDAPRVWEVPDFPPYHPEEAPNGWNDMYWQFRSYAVCAAGPDCGTWYEGVLWTFTTTAADARAQKEGASVVFNPLLSPGAADEARQAFERYARAKGFTACQ